jgi:serine/threonine protein phosphatase PrpC
VDLHASPASAWRWATLSDIGDREANQDCAGAAIDGARACWVVCDGLGGHAGGARASRVAVDALLEFWRGGNALAPREVLVEGIRHAHRAVQRAQREAEELADMRTTIVALAVADGRAAWAHVGDSRLYHLRASRIVAQSRDHSVPQMLVASGELEQDQVRRHPDRNRVIGTLGNPEDVRPSAKECDAPLGPGDSFLLCTDGFWEPVLEADIERARDGADSPEAWLARMREVHARGRGDDSDNFTATVVTFDGVRR